jgi:hypothetical protein
MLAFVYAPLNAETLRIATMNAALERKGPGLLLRDILRDDPQVTAFARVVRRVSPDILVLQGIDYDHRLTALKALRDKIDQEGGPHYPHVFASRPNTGRSTGLDMEQVSGLQRVEMGGCSGGYSSQEQKGSAFTLASGTDRTAPFNGWPLGATGEPCGEQVADPHDLSRHAPCL